MIQTILLWGQRVLMIVSAVVVIFLVIKISRAIAIRKERMKYTPKKKLKHKASGIIFGKSGLFRLCSPEKSEGMVIAFGGTGSGKTSALLIPTLNAWGKKGSGTALVIDIAGDIGRNTTNPNRVTYEPEDANTPPYFVFQAIDVIVDETEKNERLMQLAFLLIPNEIGDSDVTFFYKSEARKMLQASLIAYYYAGLDFVAICQQIVGSGFELLIADIIASKNVLANRLIAGFEGINEKTVAATKQELDKAVILFATNDKIARSVRRPSEGEAFVSPYILENRSIYIAIDDVKLELYAPLLRLIVAQSLEYLATRPNKAMPPILLCLDEFVSLGKLDILPALRKLRKKNVRIAMFTQSLADLDLVYGKAERQVILDNCTYKIVLSASDYDTQLYFSNLAGERKVVRTTYTSSHDGGSESQTLQREKIIFPEQFGRLGDSLVLFYPGGVMELRKNFYFQRW